MSLLGILSNEEVSNEYVLSKIIRYNHRCRLQDESVAEHSFFVSLFCLKIMSQLNLDKETERNVLIKAALHDTSECLTSDIPHDVKVRYNKMRAILDDIESEYYNQYWEKYKESLNQSDNIVEYIVKLADCYSVYQYCLNEKHLGNCSKEIDEITKDAVQRILEYTGKINRLLKAKAGDIK